MVQYISFKSDCIRRRVGAVIVSATGIVVGVGYNRSSLDGLSCASDCPRARSTVSPGSSYDTGVGSCIAVHAEAVALLATSPAERRNGIMYVSEVPCGGCQRLLDQAGLAEVRVINIEKETSE